MFSDSKSNSTNDNNDNNDSNGDVANEEYDIWFCIFEIKYSIGSKKYLTYTAVSVGE